MATSSAVIPLNDLHRSYLANRQMVDDAVAAVLRSGWYVLGPQVEAFESEFAAYIGVPHCVGVGCGSDALELCLAAVGCHRGDEVVTVANAGMYTSIAALKLGARIRFADVSADTLTVSVDSILPVLTERTVAVVVTHLYGRLADVEAIVTACRRRAIPVIEDCAQAVGAQRGGRRAGSFGDLSAFSFYPTKNLGGIGDGGVVATRDHALADSVRSLRQYGWAERYHVDRPGGKNSRLDEVQAAVLRAKLPFVDKWNARRRRIALRYAESLDPDLGRLVVDGGSDYVGYLAVVAAASRDALRHRLAERRIATAIHYPVPDHRQKLLRLEYATVDLPVTEDACRRVVSVPCFPELRNREVNRVCDALGG